MDKTQNLVDFELVVLFVDSVYNRLTTFCLQIMCCLPFSCVKGDQSVPQPPTTLAIYLLGPARIERNGNAVEVDTRKAIALLAYLALQRERLSRDQLAAFLWPEYDSERAYANLRRTLWALNKAVGDGWIAADNLSLELRQQEALCSQQIRFHQEEVLFSHQ